MQKNLIFKTEEDVLAGITDLNFERSLPGITIFYF